MVGARLVQCRRRIAKLPTEVEVAGSKRCSQCPHKASKLLTEVVEAAGSKRCIQST